MKMNINTVIKSILISPPLSPQAEKHDPGPLNMTIIMKYPKQQKKKPPN